jgi:protein-L-isoaspartate(D-aspartate) O-methyltransferase
MDTRMTRLRGRLRAVRAAVLLPVLLGCAMEEPGADLGRPDTWTVKRNAMISQLKRYGIKDPRVLDAMGAVRRHVFIPDAARGQSDPYGDHPCPIGHGQTISQPYIVAHMTECLAVRPGERVLEVGTGSGYQAAILAELGARVYSVEIVPELAEHARAALAAEGYGESVSVLTGDGYKGRPEHAPYDAIIVTCAPESVPRALVEQLAEGGRMILPVGEGSQRLVILRKREGRIVRQDDIPVRFVPMVHGEEGTP